MRSTFFNLVLVMFFTVSVNSAEAQFSECGYIYNNAQNIISIEDCDNPFNAVMEAPETITLEGQLLTPGSDIDVDNTVWGFFDIENRENYNHHLYRKFGDVYVRAGYLGENWDLSRYDSFSVWRLENKYYIDIMGYGINYSQFRRDNPIQNITPEMWEGISKYTNDYQPFTHLFGTGEYVLLMQTVDYGAPVPQSSPGNILGNFTKTAFADVLVPDRGISYAIPFQVKTESAFGATELEVSPFCFMTGKKADGNEGEIELSWVAKLAYTGGVEIHSYDFDSGEYNFVRLVSESGSLRVPLKTNDFQYYLTAKNNSGEGYCRFHMSELDGEDSEEEDEELEEEEPIEEDDTIGARAATLAKQVILAKYLGDGSTYGGKGWDWNSKEFITPEKVRAGYNYWNNVQKSITFGAGLDCSGLVMWAFNRANDYKTIWTNNIVKYESANGQYLNNVEEIGSNVADLRPGDLLFFSNGGSKAAHKTHVAMFVGEGKVVEAASPQLGIIESSVVLLSEDDDFIGTFHRLKNSSIAMTVRAGSPIDLIVTDPEGYSIDADTYEIAESEYLREVGNELYYSEMVAGDDGRPADMVYSPFLKDGAYIIEVVPDETAGPDSNYSLSFFVGDIEHILASKVSVNDIPAGGYTVVVSGEEVVEIIENKEIEVEIDILPFDSSNRVGALGLVPVVIYSSDTFNATKINRSSLRMFSSKAQSWEIKHDFNKDGRRDLLVFFFAQNFKDVGVGKYDAIVTGETINGLVFSGNDQITLRSFNRLNKLLERLLELEMRLFKLN